MSSPEERWWSVRAGEYVLGTLRGPDRQLFDRILAHDTGTQEEVARWQQRLAGLNDTTPDITPGEHVWPQILQRIRQLDEIDTDKDKNFQGRLPVTTDAIHGEESTEFIALEDVNAPEPASEHGKLQLWRSIAGLATAASLVLALLLYTQTGKSPVSPLSVDGLAVVLSDEDGKPYFLVETDYGNLRVRVTALAPPPLDEESDFQLWQALPDRSSVRPVALLPEEPGTSRIFTVDSLIDGSDLFGVSIERIGADTDAGPVGPVIAHGDFLPTDR